MRIGIDGRALTGRFTGDRTYWRGLLGALPDPDDTNEYLVYSRTPVPEGELPPTLNVRNRVVSAPNERVWTLLNFPAALRRDKVDLAHVQYTVPPRSLSRCPIITTVHDISFRLYPQWFPRKDRTLLNITVPLSMRQAARVITDSESSRRDMLRVYKLPPEKIVAIPLGLPGGFGPTSSGGSDEDNAVIARYGIQKPFVLAVGVLQPRKNLKMLAEAFGRARKQFGLPHRLVIVGKAGWQTEQEALRSAAAAGGGETAGSALDFPGYVEDADLPALYRTCAAFAYPSLYEGFGLPPIEAMACGAPVLVSDAPALPEVVGTAAKIVAARDVAAWSAALGEMLTDDAMRHTFAEAGPPRAACFSWQTTAERTRAVYREALATT